MNLIKKFKLWWLKQQLQFHLRALRDDVARMKILITSGQISDIAEHIKSLNLLERQDAINDIMDKVRIIDPTCPTNLKLNLIKHCSKE